MIVDVLLNKRPGVLLYIDAVGTARDELKFLEIFNKLGHARYTLAVFKRKLNHTQRLCPTSSVR